MKEYDNLELNAPRRKCKEITIPVPAKLIKIYKRPHELFKVLRGHKWNKSLFNKAVEESIDQFLKDYDAGLYGDQYVKEDGTFGDIETGMAMLEKLTQDKLAQVHKGVDVPVKE